METIINDYISRELVPDAALLPLANDTSLLDSGILDSLSLLRLVVFLEERFGITMGDADLLPENFTSVDAICAYLRAREPGKEAAHGDNRVPRDRQLPTHWFNILHDGPRYVTSAVSRSRLAGAVKAAGQGALLQQPLDLARQSINTADRFIPIPEDVPDLYAQYRPTPLRRAVRLEERLGANARIYYKYEGANLTGSHKLNTALAQAYYYSRAARSIWSRARPRASGGPLAPTRARS